MLKLTQSELRYYEGTPDIMEYPLWILMKGNFGDFEPKTGNCPITAINETTGLLCDKGIAYMRDKWAFRLENRYKTDDSQLLINGKSGEKVAASDDFGRFWRFNTSRDIIDAMACYNAMRELEYTPDYHRKDAAPYQSRRWEKLFPCLKTQWAKNEAEGFGEHFDEFHFLHADMGFVDVVVSYISVLPYCWLLKEGENHE